MIHGCHVILPVYGFWLPNDPRGSWSAFVRKWELVRFGETTKSHERRSLDELSAEELARREAARKALQYPAVTLTGHQVAATEAAIHYVEANPVRENKPKQTWSFVAPYTGLSQGGWVTYH